MQRQPCRRWERSLAAGLGIIMMFSAVARGDMVQVIVPGSADPWLAGMPDGSTASLGDFAPQQSPVDVPGLGYSSGGVLTFSVKGSVNYGGGPPVGGGRRP